MTDWATVSSFATAGGTLVLAVATFASVRSANAAARTAERALETRLRPVLVNSRLQDPVEKITWGDEHMSKVGGGRGSVEMTEEVIYLSMPLRNVGSGIAVLHSWHVLPAWDGSRPHAEPEEFRAQTRDLYVPPGDVGFWQGAIRDRDDPVAEPLRSAISGRERIQVELLYSDHEGGQRTISRFGLVPTGDGGWLCTVARHWNLDRPDPR
ncbi:MAG TPA: hypothetical protein VFC33_20540 [Acidimicrobiia bacterium]|nr:hypothetical protein [Acidimicrobiia bacterium]